VLNNSKSNSKSAFVSRRLQNANGALSRLANQMRVFLALGQSGISNFALFRKKFKKIPPCLNQLAISNFALYVIKIENKVKVHANLSFSQIFESR